MNRARRRALKKLPRAMSPWEVALVPMNMEVADAEIEGMLFVAEQSTGNVRHAGPIEVGDSLWSVLGRAIDDPAPPCAPARPTRVLTDDPELAVRLERTLGKLKARIEMGEVPRAREAAESLAEHIEGPDFPGIDVELPSWPEALRAFSEAAPWRDLPDSTLFRFHGLDALRGTVAVVMGQAGEQVGIAAYPSIDDYEMFYEGASTGRSELMEGCTSFCLYLDYITELEPADLQVCLERGLVVGDRYASAMTMSGGAALTAAPFVQRVLLAVLQGVTALAREHDDLSTPQRGAASTVLGDVEVLSEPASEERGHGPSIIDSEAAVGLVSVERFAGHDGPSQAFLVKLRKREAVRLAKALADADELWLGPCGHGVVVIAFADGEELGMLTHLEDPSMVQALFEAERPGLLVSAGGARRRGIRSADIQLLVPVRITGPGLPRLPYDPVFDGPAARWPKASATLLEFVQPLMMALDQDDERVEVLEQIISHSAQIWNAVVLSDYGQKHEALGMLMGSTRRDESAGMLSLILIDRKRDLFMGDPRLFSDVEVSRGPGGGLRVQVNAHAPSGLTLGGAGVRAREFDAT